MPGSVEHQRVFLFDPNDVLEEEKAKLRNKLFSMQNTLMELLLVKKDTRGKNNILGFYYICVHVISLFWSRSSFFLSFSWHHSVPWGYHCIEKESKGARMRPKNISIS